MALKSLLLVWPWFKTCCLCFQVPGIKALKDGYIEAIELLERIEKLANENDDLISKISTTVVNVKLNHSKTEYEIEAEVVERIQRIRFNIERGRDQIREYRSSAGEYNRNTSIELRIPQVAYGPSVETRVSFDVATDQENALLLFLGSAQEYLAFQVHDGNLQVVSGDSEGTSTVDTNLDIKKGKDDWRVVTFVK